MGRGFESLCRYYKNLFAELSSKVVSFCSLSNAYGLLFCLCQSSFIFHHLLLYFTFLLFRVDNFLNHNRLRHTTTRYSHFAQRTPNLLIYPGRRHLALTFAQE